MKIKTIGDAYMRVAGAPIACPDHACRIADLALELREAMVRFRTVSGVDLHVRIGIHTGPVVAGILGRSRYSYDLWGETVNAASRLESHGVVDAVHCSVAFRLAVGDRYHFVANGPVDLRGHGVMETFVLVRPQRSESGLPAAA